MGCAPSSQEGVRRALGDPFHTAVAPTVSPHINGWTGSQFADVPFSPPLDCMALPEDPPPYSEVAVDGQVSLLRGCSPVKQELDGGHEHTLEPWRTPSTTIQGPNSNMEVEEAGITHSFSSSDDHNVSLHEEAAHPTGLGYFPQCPELYNPAALPLEPSHPPHPPSLYNPAAVFPSYSRSVSVDGLPLAPHRRSSSSSVHSTTFFPPRQDSALPLEPSHPPHPPSLAPLHHFQGARIYPTPPTFPSHPLTRPTFPSHPLTPPTFPSHPLTPPQLHYNGSLHPHMRLPPLQHQTKRCRKRRRGHTWHGEVPAMHMQDTTQQCS